MPLNEMQTGIVNGLKGQNAGITVRSANSTEVMQPVNVGKQDIVNATSSVHGSGKGIVIRFVSWIYHSVVNLATDFKNDVDTFIHSHIFNEIEHYGEDALNIASNLFMSGMSFSGPASTEGAEKNRLIAWGKNAGVGILSNIGNIAGEIPSLGQVNGAGQSLMNIASNVGMNMQMNSMAEPTTEEHVNKPLRNAAREEAQAETLDRKDIEESYKRGKLSQGEAENQLHDIGYDSSMHQVLLDNSLNTMSADQIQGMIRDNQVTANEGAALLRKAGYSDNDTVLLVNGAKNSELVKVDNEIKNLVLDMRNQNKLSDSQMEQLLKGIGMEDDAIMKLASSNASAQIVDSINKETDKLIGLYSQGLTSSEDVQKELSSMQLEEDNIASILKDVNKEIVSSNSSDVLVSLNRSFQAGLMEEDKYISELNKMGVDEEKITSLLTQAQKKATLNGGTLKQKDLLNQNILNVAYAEGHISKEDYVALSSYVGSDRAKIDILAEELNKGSRISSVQIPMNILQEAWLRKSVDESEITLMLDEYGYSPTQQQIIIDTWNGEASVYASASAISNSSTAPSGNLTAGRDLNAISADQYQNVLHALGLNPESINSIMGLIYRTMIEAGFITEQQAITTMTNVGIDAELAREMIG